MSRFEQVEQDRPEYYGEHMKSFVDGRDMLFDPPQVVAQRFGVSRSVIITFVLLVLGVLASIYYLRFSLESSLGEQFPF